MLRNIAAVAVVAALLAAATAGAQALIDGGDVRNNSLTGKDVRNKSLTKQDFKGSVRGPRGAEGPQGPQGLRGLQGAAGTNGFGLLRYPQEVATFSDGDADTFGALCPGGTYPTGGSAWAWDTATHTVDHPEVITSHGLAFDDSGVGAGYFATVNNVASGDVDVVIDVACANANQVLPSRSRQLR